MNAAAPFSGRLDGLRAQVTSGQSQAPREVARQFEALFAQQLVAGLRATAKVPGSGVADGGPFDSLFSQQLGSLLTQGGGLGLAEQLVRQWQVGGQGDGPDAAPALPVVARAVPAATTTEPAVAAEAEAPVGAGGSIRQFVQRLLPLAREAAAQLGVAPQAILAQAALETGFGRHQPGGDSNNFFGIKAGSRWQGRVVQSETTEYRAGVAGRETAGFRAYGSDAESVADYVRLLQSPRYAAVLGTGDDVAAFAQGLQDAGYATDPRYAEKLQGLAARLAREI